MAWSEESGGGGTHEGPSTPAAIVAALCGEDTAHEGRSSTMSHGSTRSSSSDGPKAGSKRAMAPAPRGRAWGRVDQRAYPAVREPSKASTGRDIVAARPSSGMKASVREPRVGTELVGAEMPEHGRPEDVAPVQHHRYTEAPVQREPTAVRPEHRGMRPASPEQRAPVAVLPEQENPGAPAE